jgi:hypothetical protein
VSTASSLRLSEGLLHGQCDIAACSQDETGMTHIAIQEHLDGKVVQWLEKVSDEQYHR